MIYTNPVLRGFNPDPSICFDGHTYTLVTSSFEFSPGLPLYQSTDLINWQGVGAVLPAPSAVELCGIDNSQGLFAPTIRFHQGRYYVVCTNITQGTFITSATDVHGPWSEPKFLAVPAGIDPSLAFVDEHCYLTLTVAKKHRQEAEIDLLEINPLSGEVLSEITPISNGCGGRDAEAPHIYHVHDAFYLVMAEGGTREGHMVTMAKAPAITGPYLPCPYNPILSNRNVRSDIQNVGHADFFQTANGDWWLVALAVRHVNHRAILGRETILLPVNWDGVWPIVNGSGTATATVNTERIATVQQIAAGNLFTRDRIRTLGQPTPFQINADTVWLDNQPAPIAVPVSTPVAFISISQPEFAFRFEATLSVKALETGRFGMMVYKDNGSQASLDLRKAANGKVELALDRQVVSLAKADTIPLPANCEAVRFCIEGSIEQYQLTIAATNAQANPLLTGVYDSRYVSSDVADSRFTGVQIGLFAQAASGVTEFTKVSYINCKHA